MRFRFSLAKTLGKTVEELMTGRAGPISSYELSCWQALARLEEEEQKLLNL